jgi:hypothetical protein
MFMFIPAGTLLPYCDASGFHLRIIDADDLANLVKRVDFGHIWVNLGHHLETLADNHY